MSEELINGQPTQPGNPNQSVNPNQTDGGSAAAGSQQPKHPDVSNAADGTPEKKEHTRSKMAILFVLGFFAILFLCFVYAIMVGATLGDLKDTLVGVIGALSGILGFIVGYYYKSSQEQ